MPAIDVIEELFFAAPPAAVAGHFADPAEWSRQWPGLRLTTAADRGAEGVRWQVGGALRGSMEVWLEPVLDGTVLHYFLRADPARPRSGRWVTAEQRRRRLAAREVAFAVKARVEAGREPGSPPARTS